LPLCRVCLNLASPLGPVAELLWLQSIGVDALAVASAGHKPPVRGKPRRRARVKPPSDVPEPGSSNEFERIHAAAVAAFGHPYPATASGQALYWDELIASFARAHGADLTAKVFGVEVRTGRELIFDCPVYNPERKVR
jgi:hypothetical protein